MAGPGKQRGGMQVRAQRHQVHDKVSGRLQEQFQATIAHNDFLLPDADELARYQALDPALVPWLMATGGKEQEFRHESHRRKLTIREKNARSDRRLNGWGMVSAFFIFMGAMGLGAYLIHTGHNVNGTIFGSIVLVAGAGLFLARNNDKAKTEALTPPAEGIAGSGDLNK